MKLIWRLLNLWLTLVGVWVLVQLTTSLPFDLIPPALALTQEPVTPTEAMRVANENYEAGKYAEAVSIYEAILASGLRHSTVYYNLGNAYFKQGDLGRAILNYRRAQYLDPRDADVTTNLSIARTQTVDKLEAPSEEGLSNLVQLAEEWLTMNEAMLLALMLWLLMAALILLMLFKPNWRRWAGTGLGLLAVLLLVGLISMTNRSYKEQNSPAAVIVAEAIDVTSGPGTSEQYLVEFTLHSGAEVSLIESRSNWQRITLPGDLQGWVPAEAVARVSE
jgi:tetratricopeptide (TPR) repeat protein